MSERTPLLSRRAVLGGALGVLGVSFVPALAGCSASTPGPGHGASGGVRLLSDPLPRQAVSMIDAPYLPQVVAGMRSFGAALHRVDASATSNWTVSPLSITVASGMLRAGARGRTARQIDQVFGFPVTVAPQGSPHAALNALTATLVTDGPVPIGASASSTPSSGQAAPIVAVANGLFVESTFADQVQAAFLKLLATQYGAGAMAIRFTDGSAAAVINAWVATQTRDRITRLFDQLDPSTLLVLANAVYLKATWAEQFAASATQPGPFQRGSGATVTASLMHEVLDLVRYTQTPDWQRVSLPYTGGELTMRVVLPAEATTDLAVLTGTLTAAVAPTNGDAPTRVDLTLPRWDTATTVGLVKALQALGMTDAFTAGADLSGIAPRLFVSDAVHRANITVDESGTEAAAVTGYGIATSAIAGEPVTMRVDRPFAWAVVHEPTGTPLFAGHVVDPTAGASG